MTVSRNIAWFRGTERVPTTRWTTVLQAGQASTPGRKSALAELCAMYWAPVYGFIRARGRPPEEARDLTQGFFMARLLEKNDIAAADPNRGRFRSWLLTAVKSYLANDLAQARTKKRYPGAPLISLDTPDAEGHCPMLPGDHVTPERIFERRWAMTILERALLALRNKHEKRGQVALFEKLKPLLVDAGEERYREIAAELGMTEETFRVNVCRNRKAFKELIRAEVAETVSNEDDVEDEIRHLHSGLQSR